MAAPNLEKMNTQQLRDLINEAESLIAKKQKEERKTALEEARKAAAQFGFSLDELVGGTGKTTGSRRSSGGKRQLKPKFQHPEITWSGVGRKPKWIVEAEANGKLDSLAIAE